MAFLNKNILAFNRGVISSLGLARIDLDRMAFSADVQSNWMPRVLGSMMLRPGLEFIGDLRNDHLTPGRQVPFTFGVDDTAALEFTDGFLRVRIDDVLVQYPEVTSTVTNPIFATDLTGWTDNDEGSAVSSWKTGSYMSLIGTGTDAAIRTQQVTTVETSVEHVLTITIHRGDARLRVGSTDGDDDYITETQLGVGRHWLAFTPTGNFWVQFGNVNKYEVLVDICSVFDASLTVPDLLIITPYADEDLPRLRWEQSGDIIYLACKRESSSGGPANARRQMKIERRGTGRSWSVVDYLPDDGPFRVQNVGPITITPSALNGEITLTASKDLFHSDHALWGSLWRIASSGQTVTAAISSQDTFTDPIRVVGSDAARVFALILEGTWSATVTLQFAFSDSGPWNDTSPQYTVNTSISYDDGQDGQIIYYRIGVKSGDYTSGTVTATLNYTGGSIQGIARAHTFTSSTVMSASVIKDFGAITASSDWWEGEWSQRRGYPTSVVIHEGRLWWAGLDKIFGSISDAYESFDDNTVGDSGPILRSIGSGPIRVIHWLMSMGRMLFGTSDNSANIASTNMDGNNPLGAHSSSFDEPLTPSNFQIKTISSRGVFVDRTKQRIYELTYDIDQQDYKPVDLSVFAPDFNEIGITQIAMQMKPDIRIHCVREDGTVGVLVYDRLENVICWVDVVSDGATGVVEDISVLPGVVEDQVYYIVKRTINGGTQRHLCKWALESEATGGQLNKIADSFVVYDSTATTSPFTTELLHLRDETVVVWADGADVGEHTVSATGGITLAVAASKVVAGLPYTAQFKSTKLGEIAGFGLLDRKKVQRVGFIAENMHYQGLQYGADFTNLNDLPAVEDGTVTPADTIHADYHEDNFPFGGEWDSDSRICLQAQAPRPCTMKAIVAEIESVERPSTRRQSGRGRGRPRT